MHAIGGHRVFRSCSRLDGWVWVCHLDAAARHPGSSRRSCGRAETCRTAVHGTSGFAQAIEV